MDKPSEKRRFADECDAAGGEKHTDNGGASERIGAGTKNGEKRTAGSKARERNIGGSGSFFRRAPEEVGKSLRFEYIEEKAKAGEISLYCRVLRVTVQGYKKHLKNKAKPYKYAQLLADMRAILAEDVFNKTYGKQRMYEKLQLDYDCGYSYNTVAKVMRENGLLQKENKPVGLTKSDKEAQKSDNLLRGDFTAEKPCEKIVTDITEFTGSDGKVYTSGVFDCFDNACLGLTIEAHMQKELVISTFEQAYLRYDLSGAVSHSDRGSQYTSSDFRLLLDKFGIKQSMNSAAGRCLDNAKCESMWARAKHEILACFDTSKMKCHDLAVLIQFYFLDYWNHRRICSAIGGVPPMIKRNAYYLKLHDSSIAA